MAGALLLSTVIVVILFAFFLCYQYMKGDKTLRVRTPPSDYKGQVILK